MIAILFQFWNVCHPMIVTAYMDTTPLPLLKVCLCPNNLATPVMTLQCFPALFRNRQCLQVRNPTSSEKNCASVSRFVCANSTLVTVNSFKNTNSNTNPDSSSSSSSSSSSGVHCFYSLIVIDYCNQLPYLSNCN